MANPVAAENPGAGMSGSTFSDVAPGQGKISSYSAKSTPYARLAAALAKLPGQARPKASKNLFLP